MSKKEWKAGWPLSLLRNADSADNLCFSQTHQRVLFLAQQLYTHEDPGYGECDFASRKTVSG